MPVIRLYATIHWLPDWKSAHYDYDNRMIEQQPEYAVTQAVLTALPRIVVDAINAVDGSQLTAGEAWVMPMLIHPWAKNASDMWIDVQPGERPGFRGHFFRKSRRIKIANRVRAAVWAEMAALPAGKRPVIDYECRPLEGSGMTTESDGHIAHIWGAPKNWP